MSQALRDLAKTPSFVEPGLARGRLFKALSLTAANDTDDLRYACPACCGTGLEELEHGDCPKCGGAGRVW